MNYYYYSNNYATPSMNTSSPPCANGRCPLPFSYPPAIAASPSLPFYFPTINASPSPCANGRCPIIPFSYPSPSSLCANGRCPVPLSRPRIRDRNKIVNAKVDETTEKFKREHTEFSNRISNLEHQISNTSPDHHSYRDLVSHLQRLRSDYYNITNKWLHDSGILQRYVCNKNQKF